MIIKKLGILCAALLASGALFAAESQNTAPKGIEAMPFIVKTPQANLTGEQALSTLSTGVMKVTTTTGTISTAVAGTDYYAPGGTDVAFADGGTGLSTAADDTVMVSSGSAWVAKALTDCDGASSAVTYDTTTNAWGCNTISGGGTTWTSVTITNSDSPYTVTGNYKRIFANAASGAITVICDAATQTDVEVIKIDTSGNAITIDPTSTQTIASALIPAGDTTALMNGAGLSLLLGAISSSAYWVH